MIDPVGGSLPPARVWRRFYVAMALTCAAVAVFGFLPTFFVPLSQGAFDRPPVFYFHIILFFLWPLYFLAQTWLVASGRMMAHRTWGTAGAALATAMVISVFAAVIVRLNQTPAIPEGGVGSRSFAWVDASGMLYFGACIVAALATTQNPEAHKRWMLIATISLLNAPMARWNGVIYPGMAESPPMLPTSPAGLFIVQAIYLSPALLMVAAMVFDQRVRGRISLIYSVGLPVYLIMLLTQPLVGASPSWLAVADWLKAFSGQ